MHVYASRALLVLTLTRVQNALLVASRVSWVTGSVLYVPPTLFLSVALLYVWNARQTHSPLQEAQSVYALLGMVGKMVYVPHVQQARSRTLSETITRSACSAQTIRGLRLALMSVQCVTKMLSL